MSVPIPTLWQCCLALLPQSCAEQHLNISDGALSPALHPLAGTYDEARNMRLFKTCGNHF